MKKHYLSKFFLIGMMSAALPSQVDAQIKVLFDVAAPKGMTDQEVASREQVLYISNNASLLDDTEYIARTNDWSVAPVVKDGKVLSVSLKRSLYQDGAGECQSAHKLLMCSETWALRQGARSTTASTTLVSSSPLRAVP